MAYTIVHTAFLNNTSGTQAAGSASSISVTAGNALIVWILTTTSGLQTVSGNSNTYTYQGSSTTISGCFLSVYTCQNAAAGATAVTTSDTGCFDIFVEEVSGLATSGTIPTPVFSTQSSPGTGTNILTVGGLTVTAPCGVFAFTCDVSSISAGGAGNGGVLSAGTTLAWTGRTTGWAGSTAIVTGVAEDIEGTTGSMTATFGITSNKQFDNFISGVIALPEPSGGGAIYQPFTQIQFFVSDNYAQF